MGHGAEKVSTNETGLRVSLRRGGDPARGRQVDVTRGGDGRGEIGSSLILALVFLVVVSLISLGLLRWIGNDLINVTTFATARSAQTAADGATQMAIQNVRYNFTTGAAKGSPQTCLSTGGATDVYVGPQDVAVWCTTVWNPDPSTTITRVVTFVACLNYVGITEAVCAASPLLQTVVDYDDYSLTGGISTCSPGYLGATTCGKGMRVVSWVFRQ